MKEEKIKIQMCEIAENIYKKLKKEGKIMGYEHLITLTYPQFYKWGNDGKEKILSPSGMSRAISGERGIMPDVYCAILYSFLKAGADKESIAELLNLYEKYYGIVEVKEAMGKFD